MFDYFISVIINKFDCENYEEMLKHYYDIMELNNLDDNDIFKMTKKEILKLVK